MWFIMKTETIKIVAVLLLSLLGELYLSLMFVTKSQYKSILNGLHFLWMNALVGKSHCVFSPLTLSLIHI